MQKQINKVIAMAIIILLSFSMTSVLISQIASAHTPPWTVPTYAYISVAPNPIGVGQSATVVFWLDKVPIGATGPWGSRWHGFTVTITKPDGTTEKIGPINSDSNGGASTRYTPTQIGTYDFLFEFPGQIAQNENPAPHQQFIGTGLDYVNDTFSASSASTTLTVQEEQIQLIYGGNPLPTEYWTRPMNSMNREWYSLAGNWLGLASTSFGTTGMYSNTGNFNPYTTAPNTAHVMWTEPLSFGGQVGGEFGPEETGLYATGTAYEAKFSAIAMNGILYYTMYPGAGNNPAGLKAIDIRTGETIWEDKNIITPLKVGMILNFITGDQYGAHAYLFCAPATVGFIPYPPGNAWEMYDAMTGQWILNINNTAAGTLVQGPNGEILSYSIAGGKLTMWNSTKCISAGAQKNLFFTIYSANETWRPPIGKTIEWADGNQWSVPVATNINNVPIFPGLGVSKVTDDVVLATATLGGIFFGPPGGSQLGYRIDAGYSATDGHLLWGPVNRTLTPFTTFVLQAGEGKYAEYIQQTMTWTCYDISSGQKLWGPSTPVNNSWAYYDYTAPADFAYGNFYTWGLSGQVFCYDADTGALKWRWYAGDAGLDTPYGVWPLGTWSNHHIIADDKLYVRAGHDYTPPVFKGAKLYCINATSGEGIWDSLSFDITGSPIAADGYMVWFNGYDNQIYCYGKGPTKVTVTAPAVGVTTSTPITISGTITDISDGTKQDAVAKNFPNGLPCISDTSMSRFMEAVYQQQPMPIDLTGVPVTINVVDANGNYRTIGTAISNVYGTYSLTWTPDIPGDYTVIANFAGTESYYASEAAAAFYASEPAATASPQPTQPASLADQYILPGIIGIIVAIAIGFAITILVLKKKP